MPMLPTVLKSKLFSNLFILRWRFFVLSAKMEHLGPSPLSTRTVHKLTPPFGNQDLLQVAGIPQMSSEKKRPWLFSSWYSREPAPVTFHKNFFNTLNPMWLSPGNTSRGSCNTLRGPPKTCCETLSNVLPRTPEVRCNDLLNTLQMHPKLSAGTFKTCCDYPSNNSRAPFKTGCEYLPNTLWIPLKHAAGTLRTHCGCP